jgi:hypothetical protein
MPRHRFSSLSRALVVAAPVLALTPLVLGGALVGASEGPPPEPWTPVIEAVDSPAAPGSGQPQLSVSSRGVLLSWIERAGSRATLRFAERTAAGWSAPVTVASGEDWFVNWADVPSVLRLENGTLVAHWLQKSGPDTYAYDVRLAYSKDDGRTWSASFLPHHDGTKTEHGFASLFQDPAGGLGLIWLDGRAMASESHGAAPDAAPAAGHSGVSHGASHDAEPRGAMSVRYARFDDGWKQVADMAVDLRVCECCPTTAAVTSRGVIVAYRDRSGGEIRDIHVSRLENGAWTLSTAVHEDGWHIAACPVNGPMLSTGGDQVALAWFTAESGQGRAFVAFSSDAGRTFGPPVRLDEGGSLGRVDLELVDDGSAVATWIEFGDGRAELRARRVGADGAISPAVAVASLEGSRASGYPRVARSGDELVFAWTESRDGKLSVRTAVARTPASSSR